ncbi:MAG: hypothetical protein JSR78_08465 [Proteobacteria bacterium]|nr:hypothetical protein [Pseudomonadota bacterium]
MEEFGAKGGAAGVAQMGAAWERLKTSIGDTGFGDTVGKLARNIGSLFDTMEGGPSWIKEGVGWGAMLLNGLSDAALPIMAFSGLTGIVGSLGSGFGTLIEKIGGTTAALRILGGVTLVGAGIFAAYELYQHWDQVAAAVKRTATALKDLAQGSAQPIKQLSHDVTKALGFGDHVHAVLHNLRSNAIGSHQLLYAYGTETALARAQMSVAKDALEDAKRFKALYHPAPTGPHHFSRVGQATGVDAAAYARQAAAERTKAEISVKTTLDPIVVHGQPTTVQVEVHGKLDNVQGSGSGSMPLSATAPHGTTAASPANPQVSR